MRSERIGDGGGIFFALVSLQQNCSLLAAAKIVGARLFGAARYTNQSGNKKRSAGQKR